MSKDPKMETSAARIHIYPKSNGRFACLHCGAPVTSGGSETFVDKKHECLTDCTNVPCAKASSAIETPSSTTYSPLSIPCWESELLESLPPGSTVDGKDTKYYASVATNQSPSLRMQQEERYDVVNRPRHYTKGSIEVWDFIKDQGLDYMEGNVVKYVCRYKHKNGLEDLRKAKAYLDKLVEGYEILERYK